MELVVVEANVLGFLTAQQAAVFNVVFLSIIFARGLCGTVAYVVNNFYGE